MSERTIGFSPYRLQADLVRAIAYSPRRQQGSETNSLLGHGTNEPSTEEAAGGQNAAANKPQSVFSYEAAPAGGASTVGYGAVGQGHAVLGEEGRLRVQSIASAVEK
jgi:hypothetical protein